MNNVKKNLMYNACYQIFILIMPFITVPYVSRTLGAMGVGIYSYTYSIVYYFMIIAMLGINNYGNRTIAKVRDDKEQLSKSFWGIYTLQIVMCIIMIVFYLIYVFVFSSNYKFIFFIQIIYLFSTMFDINWFFFGLEKFKLTVIRSTIVKLISLIFIFIFVRDSNDVWIYTLILSSSMLVSQLLLFKFLKKEIYFIKIKIKDVIKHIKPCLILFIPVIAVSLYKIMDKIMLGKISNILEVGYYEQAEKIINIPMGIVTALGTVMLPRVSNLVSNGDFTLASKYIKKSVNFMMFLAFPISFGLIAISDDFIPLFLGKEFTNSIVLLNYLSVTILFISFANVIRTQYLIPKERDKDYIISVSLGAVINLVVNYILIPKYKSVGACIGTILAEFFVMLYQIITVKKELPILGYLKEISIFFIKTIVMFIIILLIELLKFNSLITIILQVLIGCVTYVIMNLRFINTLVDFDNIIQKLKKKYTH